MNISHLAACGVLITLLCISTEAKPLTQAQQKSLRSVLGEELSKHLASEEWERKLENMRSKARLLRDLRLDTRAKGMWARILNEQPNSRRHKAGTKKGAPRPGRLLRTQNGQNRHHQRYGLLETAPGDAGEDNGFGQLYF